MFTIDYSFIKQYFWHYKVLNINNNKTLPIIIKNNKFIFCYNDQISSDIINLNIKFSELKSVFFNKKINYYAVFDKDNTCIIDKLSNIYKLVYINMNGYDTDFG